MSFLRITRISMTVPIYALLTTSQFWQFTCFYPQIHFNKLHIKTNMCDYIDILLILSLSCPYGDQLCIKFWKFYFFIFDWVDCVTMTSLLSRRRPEPSQATDCSIHYMLAGENFKKRCCIYQMPGFRHLKMWVIFTFVSYQFWINLRFYAMWYSTTVFSCIISFEDHPMRCLEDPI